MSDLVIQRAVRRNKKARIALLGPSGAGKSYTALRWAFALAPTGKVAAIDTEHESLSLYANEEVDGKVWQFDTINLDSFSPENYIESIKKIERAGYEVLIIDSLSHAWSGKDGTLEYVDNISQRDTSGNKFTAWRKGSQIQNEMVEAILAAKMHIIVTMRVKMEYIQEKDDRGKTVVRKVGLQPVQRDGLEYEFDLVCDMQEGNNLSVAKTRCSLLNEKFYRKPGTEPMEILMKWLNSGAPAPVVEAPTQKSQPQQSTQSREIVVKIQKPNPEPAHEESIAYIGTSNDKWKWVLDGKRVDGFFKTANDKFGLSDDEALEALGVSGLVEYRGAPADAMAALLEYVNEHAKESIPVMPETADEQA